MEKNTCPTCHAPIPAKAPGGFCPVCLLRDAEEPPTSGHSAPPIEEIAAAFPQWEILELIGQGGMGVVYKVRQPGLDRVVALKILTPELGRDPAFAERFAREARTLGKLHHPNIVTVFEHGEKDGFFYLLMEYSDGVNLRQAMRAGRFTPEQALAIVPGICDALQQAHAQGIWHRDIKPENILLDRDGKVKIADFGIARIVGDPQRDFTLTRTGNALGSVSYMAPEQHEKPHDVDHRADIYSLGVVIYEMLTGELPLGRFPAPSQRAAVDARIDEIVFKTLEKERELRQQSADEVKTEMQIAGNPASRSRSGSDRKTPVGGTSSPNSAFIMTLAAVGLYISGLAATAIGSQTVVWLVGVGLVAAFLGWLGCHFLLWRIQRGAHPLEHRTPLMYLAFWPTVVGLSLVGYRAWISLVEAGNPVSGPWVTPGWGAFGYAVVALLVPTLASMVMWHGWGKGPERLSKGFLRRVRVPLAVMVALFGIALSRYLPYREAQYESYRANFIQLHDDITPEDFPMVLAALDRALGEKKPEFRVNLYESSDPENPSHGKYHESPFIVLECVEAEDGVPAYRQFETISSRLRSLLPKRIGVNNGAGFVPSANHPDAPEHLQREFSKMRSMDLWLVAVPIAVVLLVTPIGGIWSLVPAAFAMALGLVLHRTPWPGLPEGFPPQVNPENQLSPLAAPEYDFSTTRDAMESLVKAAGKGDLAGFKRGISETLLRETIQEDPGMKEPMKEWARLSYSHRLWVDGDKAGVRMKKPDGKTFDLQLMREDGEWKVSGNEN